jgi:hypothetical protein
MEQSVPLPRLFMRCVIQATLVMPRLMNSTIQLLLRLITQQVGVLSEGWWWWRPGRRHRGARLKGTREGWGWGHDGEGGRCLPSTIQLLGRLIT